ncbi:MAG: hypothetical protein MPW14_21585 [Candidatus Manganitrophus sp.]|nr:MAG: hypothetical protein MPW14_21585 [Candidatus Manganitrophus sp.]
MSQSSVKALLVSAGGDLAPTIFVVNRLRPEALCFFVAEAQQGGIDREIIPKIEQPPGNGIRSSSPTPKICSSVAACCFGISPDWSPAGG